MAYGELAGYKGDVMSAVSKKASPKPRGIRQTMSDLHIWTGLLVGWVLYAVFLTGTVSFFREELSHYMRPELAVQDAGPNAAELVQRTVDTIRAQHPATTQLSVQLPTERKAVTTASWRDPAAGGRGFASVMLDPSTGAELSARATRGGDFFYAFHFNFYYMSGLWARWIIGFCAMFMLVAIVSGVITHKKIFADFFTFRPRKGQRSWLDAHAALSVFGLPFHFMITWSGLVTLMVLYMPWGLHTLPTPADKAAVTSEMRFVQPAMPPAGLPATLHAVAPLVQQAEQRWGASTVGSVQITQPNDVNARITIVQSQTAQVSTTPKYMVFDGVSGELLQAKEASGPVATTQGVLYGLHLGRFADIETRWLYFVVGLVGTAMVGSGLVLWTVKRRSKLANPDKPYFGFRLVERLNIATIAGLSIAMVAFLWLNRWLPVAMEKRAEWEIHGFFIVWLASLIWALVRPAKRAWVELLTLAAGLCFLLPIANMLGVGSEMPSSLAQPGWLFLSVDLSLWLLAALHALMAWRVAQHKPPRPRPVAKKPAPVARSAPVSQEA